MNKASYLDPLLQWMKRVQRRIYYADYSDETARQSWLRRPEGARFEEARFGVEIPREALKSVLLFKPDDIGDAVHALPAAWELRKALPHAHLAVLCQHKTRPLFERSGLFDSVASMDVQMKWLRVPSFDVGPALKELGNRRWDLSVFLRTYPGYFRSFLKIASQRKLHPLDPRMPSRSLHRYPVSLWGEQRAHQALQMLELVAPITGKKYSHESIAYPPLAWTDADARAIEKTFPNGIPDRFYVVHPFAKFETRRYPESYWRDVLGALKARLGGEWVVLGGAEDPHFEGLDGAIQMQGTLSLAETGYLLSRASGFLGNLSGPAHLAASMGTPTITFMGGHSLAAEWAPLGNSLLMRAEVPCAPCHKRTCPEYKVACLSLLEPAKVIDPIARFLEAGRSVKV